MSQNKTPLNILVVDDAEKIRLTLSYCLENEGHRVTAVGSADETRRVVARESFDLIFLDLRLENASGLDLIPLLLEQCPWVKIVVITAYASIESAVEAMKAGASDYLPKPFTPDQVRLVARKAAETRFLEHRLETLRENLKQAGPEASLESGSPAMRQAVELARQVAESDATVLLTGESGTGKGIFARAIHGWSFRSEKPFAIVHCPSLAAELLESELFGHVKGAFTGAVSNSPGRIAKCEGGTLFLDEIAELPTALQPKLLRFVQDREFERVGDSTTRRADVRLLVATNQDLGAAVREGRFREDLFYRLNVVEIQIPPLRRRKEDVLPLARGFLAFYAGKYNRRVTGFTGEAEAALGGYEWPGNVRELQNTVERAVILSRAEQIDANALPFAAPPDSVYEPEGLRTLGEVEEAHIRRVLETTDNLDEAARILGIDPSTLWRRRRKYGI